VSKLRLVLANDTRMSGGSSETDVKEFTVTPAGWPALSTVVTTAIPVGKRPSASRNSRDVKLMLQMGYKDAMPATASDTAAGHASQVITGLKEK